MWLISRIVNIIRIEEKNGTDNNSPASSRIPERTWGIWSGRRKEHCNRYVHGAEHGTEQTESDIPSVESGIGSGNAEIADDGRRTVRVWGRR